MGFSAPGNEDWVMSSCSMAGSGVARSWWYVGGIGGLCRCYGIPADSVSDCLWGSELQFLGGHQVVVSGSWVAAAGMLYLLVRVRFRFFLGCARPIFCLGWAL